MGILTTLFGGSKQKSESGNKNLNLLNGMYTPMAQGGTDAFNTYGNALGIGGDFGAQQEAYDNFLDNSGYKYVLDQGMQGVTNSAAGKFLLRSGSTAKALQDRSVNIGKTFFENYLDRLSDQSRLGLGAGGLLADAGQYSKGSGSSHTDGAPKALGAALALFSDARLKRIHGVVEVHPDGLQEVEFEYRKDTGVDLPEGRFRGVVAQDVANLRPWALGPTRQGHMTVDYGALEAR